MLERLFAQRENAPPFTTRHFHEPSTQLLAFAVHTLNRLSGGFQFRAMEAETYYPRDAR